MIYEQWRDDIFGQPAGSDPVNQELSRETYEVPVAEAFDHIDRALLDPDIHSLFSADQIAFGLSIIYNPSCSDLPFCYTESGNEHRRVHGIGNLQHLYSEFFLKYCATPVTDIGNAAGGPLGQICYMFWDVFVLHPGNATQPMTEAGLHVMKHGINLPNENCAVSAIHGLGHWVFDAPEAKSILRAWLRKPNTENTALHEYAEQAITGCIL